MTATVPTSRVGVWSEAGRLRRVMVCSPGLAHLRLTPDNCDALLYDDVMWVSQAKRDHFDFVVKMRDRGIEVLDMLDLLTDVVGMPQGRRWILDWRITEAQVGTGLVEPLRAWLDELPSETLAEHLIGGLAFDEVPADAGGPFLAALRHQEEFLFPAGPAAEHPVHARQQRLGVPGRQPQPDGRRAPGADPGLPGASTVAAPRHIGARLPVSSATEQAPIDYGGDPRGRRRRRRSADDSWRWRVC